MERGYLSRQPGLYAVQIGDLVKIGRSRGLRSRLKAHVRNGLTGGLVFPVQLRRPDSIGNDPDLVAAETFALGLARRMHGEPALGAEYFSGLELERAGEFVRAAARSHGWPMIETEELDMPKLMENLRTMRPTFRMVAS
jgi:hypothetical protein